MDTEEKHYIKKEVSKNKNSENSEEENDENDNILDSKGFKKRDHYSKNDESSSFVNKNNYSTDSKFLNNSEKYKGKFYKGKYNFDEDFQRIEKRNKDNVLCGDLNELIGEIERENINFKKNVFMKNFKNMHSNIGIFDKELIPPLQDDIEKVLNEYHSTEFLVQKYTQKAENINEED